MRAAVFDAPFALRLGEVDRPRPGPGEALVRVAAAGICAGDLYIYVGKSPYATYPRVGGHEISGTLVELGPGTSGPEIGARVVVEPFIGCGTCYPCRVGKPNCCANLRIVGIHCDGGFAEHMVAPVRNLHAVPDGLSLRDAAFAEPLAIGVQACRRGEVAAGDRLLVLGAGPIGLAILEVARSRGADVWITDVNQRRLDRAASLGGHPLRPENLAAEVARLTAGEGMPVVIEATGSPRVMAQTVDLVAAGGRIVIVGLAKKGEGVTLPGLDLTRKEVTLHGSRASADCFPEALRLLAGGAIRYTALATFLSLDEAPDTFALLARDQGALDKAVFALE